MEYFIIGGQVALGVLTASLMVGIIIGLILCIIKGIGEHYDW